MQNIQDISPPPSPISRGHIPALDGLRGCAILLVLAWHYFHTAWFPGWTGVDLFFVLSGYLITGRLLKAKDHPHYFSRFYRNRILRIFPLYYGLVIPFLIAIGLFVRKEHLPHFDFYLQHWKSLLLFTTNWTFVFFGLPKDYSLVPLWSIAVEEQFYLIWPLLILLTRAKFRLRLLGTLFILIFIGRCLAWLLFPAQRDTLYYHTFFRLDGLIAGSLLCLFQTAGIHLSTTRIRSFAVALLMILLLGILSTHNGNPHNAFFSTAGFTVNALLFACLLHLSITPGNRLLSRLLEHPSLRFTGKISYCLYLIHIPILLNIGPRLFQLGLRYFPGNTAIVHWTTVSLCLLLSFLLSALSYRYFESFFLRLKK